MDSVFEDKLRKITDVEKQLIDKKYAAIIKKVNNDDFPYKKQLQKRLPDVDFW